MPLTHLDKHSRDGSGSMRCHRLNPIARSLSHFDRNIYSLNISKLYVVLAIALNQVEDDIQLTDLLRLIEEEHLTSRYMLNYLPENVAINGKTLLKQMEFGHQIDKCRYNVSSESSSNIYLLINTYLFSTCAITLHKCLAL